MTGCPRPSGRPPRAVQPSDSRAHPDYTRSFYLLTQLKYPFYLTSLTDALIFPPSSLHGFKPHARLFATDIGDWWSTTLSQVIQIKRFTFIAVISFKFLLSDSRVKQNPIDYLPFDTQYDTCSLVVRIYFIDFSPIWYGSFFIVLRNIIIIAKIAIT